MRIKRLVLVCVVGCLAVGGSWLLAQSQGGASSQPSLGDLARQLKEQRAEAARKPSKVFTNDNLPARPAGRGVSVAAAMSTETTSAEGEQAEAESATPQTSEAESTEAKSQGSEAATAEQSESQAGAAHDEAWYRDRAAAIRSQLDIHQRELNVLEQKLSQNQMQFYNDPNKTLQQEFSRKDVDNLAQDIEKKKQEIAADEQAMTDLQDQLRREGAPSGWLR
jgi:TATA-binding protein-associated factor Taf7